MSGQPEPAEEKPGNELEPRNKKKQEEQNCPAPAPNGKI